MQTQVTDWLSMWEDYCLKLGGREQEDLIDLVVITNIHGNNGAFFDYEILSHRDRRGNEPREILEEIKKISMVDVALS